MISKVKWKFLMAIRKTLWAESNSSKALEHLDSFFHPKPISRFPVGGTCLHNSQREQIIMEYRST